MHILFVSPTFPPENGWGGIGTYVHHISLMLANAGNKVTVLCDRGKTKSDFVRNSVRVCRYLKSSSNDSMGTSQEVADAIKSLISEQPIDVVEFPEFGANGLIFQRQLPFFPVVVRLHGDTTLCREANGPPWKRAAMHLRYSCHPADIDRLERESVRLAHAVTAPSNWEVEQCKRRNWEFGQLTAVFPNAYNLKQTEGKRNAPHCPPKILHLARLDYRKGADLLPLILRKVWKSIPEAEFDFVGQDEGRKQGSWTDWILNKTPARFHKQLKFRGGVPYEQIPALIRDHSVAFFCSVWESFSYTLLECMSEGVPCINASGGGSWEVGINNESVINTPRRPDLIGTEMVRVLTNRELHSMLSRNARRRAEALSNPETLVPKAISVYEDAIRIASKANLIATDEAGLVARLAN